jgi:hypothetical protein
VDYFIDANEIPSERNSYFTQWNKSLISLCDFTEPNVVTIENIIEDPTMKTSSIL